MTEVIDTDRWAALKTRAERIIRDRLTEAADGDATKGFDDLDLHRIELDLQNEELRQTEIELERVRDEYADLYEHAPVGYLTLDRAGLVRRANVAASALLGVDQASLPGSPLSPRLEAEAARELRLAIARASETDRPVEIGIDHPRPDGGDAALRFRIAPRHRADGFELWVTIIDVTVHRAMNDAVAASLAELNEAQAALRAERDFSAGLVETAPVIVLVLDDEARIVQLNRFMETLTGRSLDEVRGTSWFDTFVPEKERELARALFLSTPPEKRTLGGRNEILAGEGSTVLIEWSETSIHDALGRVQGLLAIGRDVTQERLLEREYLQAQKMEAIATLAAGVAHDFNNLLMGVIGMADIALTKLSDHPDVARHVRDLRKAARGGVALVNQLMVFSRGDEPAPENALVDSMIASAWSMLGVLMGEDVEMHLDLDAPGGHVSLAPGQLEQVLMNLCVNARHAMPNAGRLAVRTKIREIGRDDPRIAVGITPGSFVEITVADTGCGMDEDTRRRVFEPFFTTKARGGGTGLGLTAVYGIVRRARGHIDVDTRVGVGTSFRILLPRVRPTDATLDAPRSGASLGKGETILVLEDEPLVRMAVEHYLQKQGYRVFVVGSANMAIELAREVQGTIDLILADTVLPGMQGPEAVEQLATIVPEARVVFMSAHSKSKLVEEGRVSDTSIVIQKPFTEDALAVVVRRVLDDRPTELAPREATTQRTILLVEDHDMIRDAIRELFEEAGHTVLAAGSVGEAMALAVNATVDLVLTDLSLPDGSGLDVCRALEPARAPVLVLTGRDPNPALMADLGRYRAELVTKPIDLSRLSALVSRTLRR